MRSSLLFTVIVLSACLPGLPEAIGSAVPPPLTIQDAQPKSYREAVHWARRMSLTVMVNQNKIPIAKQVVLVPDAATFLDELSLWSEERRWPILYEDDFYAPMFIRSYEPEVVFRRASVGKLPKDMESRRALIDRSMANSMRKPDMISSTYSDLVVERGLKPKGAVFTSLRDPAWPAAVTLATARRQHLIYLDDELGGPSDILSQSDTLDLMRKVHQNLEATGTLFKELDDEIDFLTFCRSMPARADIDMGQQLPEGLPPQILDGPKAITDVLGRHPDGERYAFTGWIVGGQRASLYSAMCSFFLTRTNVWLGDSYQNEPDREAYRMNVTAAMFEHDEYEVELHENMTLRNFQDSVTTGLDTDQVYMNSSGNADFFDLGTDRASPYEVPVLNRPAFLYLIHSWSMKRPDDPETIGGRWLRNGVYAAYGSSHEPLLNGFRPAYEVARRIISNIPLGPSVRLWDGEAPLAVSWRINLFGDPMMLSGGPRISRRTMASVDGHGAENLNETAQKLLEEAVAQPDDRRFADVIDMMTLINLDGMASDLWKRAVKEAVAGPLCAKAALGPLFRLGNRDDFMLAWAKLDRQTTYQRDMLWSLMAPTLGPNTDATTADLMSAAIRPRYPVGDMRRIAPILSRLDGPGQVVALIDQLESTAVNRREKRGLAELRKLYKPQ
ncbi:MAG: hypothetical protein CMJ24_11875 [Phycisphaerae bacterium]|nr:hypothetical protein [Phycisphaerae bacterium]